MLVYPIAIAAFLLMDASSSVSAAKSKTASTKTPTKYDFMRVMEARKNKDKGRRRRLSIKEFNAELYSDSKRSKALRKKMIEKSTVAKPPGGDSAAAAGGGGRKLQNYNNYNANANGNYNNADAEAYYANRETTYKYNNQQDGADDYFTTYGEWDNTFGFDPTQFSISYHRCASVRQFDDEIAASEDSDSVFATKHFAIFRFCPEATCMGFEEEEDDCGCESQCEAIACMEAENGYEAGDDDDEACETACATECVKWQQQYNMYSGDQANNAQDYAEAQDEGQGDGNRNLQNYNNYNNGDDQYGYNGQYNRFSSYAFDPYYVDEEEDGDVYGARGEGCQSNYGEYMIEMKDYLDLMLEYQEERLEVYCEYCEECMYKVYKQWLQNGGQRDLKYDDFKNSKEHQKMRDLGNYYGVCPEYDTCAEYQNICQGGIVDEYSDYFECTEVEKSNGMVAYIGLHCAADGFDITLGVFSDEYCNEYIGNGVDIASFLGEEIEEEALKSYFNSAYGPTLEQLQFVNEDQVCIPCRKGDLMWEEDGNNGDDDSVNYDSDEINEICESLYEVSAHCDKHFRAYSNKSKQSKYAEAVAQEDLTCDFIDSVVMGNYNEAGFVDLGDDYTIEKQSGWMTDSMYGQQYGHYITEVTPLQIFGLLASIMAVILLAVWSMTLHKSLTKGGPWRPRRGLQRPTSPAATDLNRQNSGIVMGRSQSNASYYMS